MVEQRSERVALMAIQPVYARAILDGLKKVEFRKRALADDVRTVLIYETAPTQRVVGEFTLGEVVVDTPRRIWRRFRTVGCIAADNFAQYYEGYDCAVALSISSVTRYAEGIALDDLEPTPAVPQSFVYLSWNAVEQVRQRQTHSSLVRAVASVS
jgi:predicted transcriptional regulator